MRRLREPANALTHMIGAVLSVAGLGYLIYLGTLRGPWHLASFLTFGISLILLYTASTVYHAVKASPKALQVLRKVDHVMIFVLIAGSYTPFCLLPLRGPWGWSLLGTIWGLALVGAITKLFWINAPRWLSTGFYLLMGWLVVVAVYPMVQTVETPSLILLAIGGLFYTSGAILYGTKWPNPWPGRFGFQDLASVRYGRQQCALRISGSALGCVVYPCPSGKWAGGELWWEAICPCATAVCASCAIGPMGRGESRQATFFDYTSPAN